MYVLIMVIGLAGRGGGIVIQQEFTSFQKCEAARVLIVKNKAGTYETPIRSQGCYAK